MRVFQLCLSESIGGVLTNGRCAHAPHPTPGLGEAKEGASLVGCVHTLPTLLRAWARLVWGAPLMWPPAPLLAGRGRGAGAHPVRGTS